jgi:hypothetical protein
VRVVSSTGGADTVWLALTVLPALQPPARLTAYWQPDGRVRLAWSSVAAADTYYVYRATHVDMFDAQRILTTVNTFALDSTVQVVTPDSGVARFYQVTSVGHWPQAVPAEPAPR